MDKIDSVAFSFAGGSIANIATGGGNGLLVLVVSIFSPFIKDFLLIVGHKLKKRYIK